MRKRARTDLCGGRSAMAVPTATVARRATWPYNARCFRVAGSSNARDGLMDLWKLYFYRVSVLQLVLIT
jgi:hypothetical protein